MRVLLDESLPVDMAAELPGFQVSTVVGMGWSGIKNGALLRRIESCFEAFVTMDQNLPHQQRLAGRELGVVIVRARSNRMSDLSPLLPDLRDMLAALKPGDLRLLRSKE